MRFVQKSVMIALKNAQRLITSMPRPVLKLVRNVQKHAVPAMKIAQNAQQKRQPAIKAYLPAISF
jgi:hypothetical protein